MRRSSLFFLPLAFGAGAAHPALAHPAHLAAHALKAGDVERGQVNGAPFGTVRLYDWREGSLYAVLSAPDEVTDIVLQPGEVLAGTGPVAAGDTLRWVIGDTVSGKGASQRVHVLVKPTSSGLRTNLLIDTDRRTYHLELRSGPAAYMAEVSWRYPQDGLLAIRQASPPPMTLAWPAAPSPMAAPALDLDRLDFRYRIVGPKVSWRPLQAFDDGRQTFIEFPADIAEKDLPPLFLLGPDGKSLQLVNYRVQGRHMVVDRIFQTAALQMGDRRSEARVLIERER